MQENYALEINNNFIVNENNNFKCINELFFNEYMVKNKKTLCGYGKKVYNEML